MNKIIVSLLAGVAIGILIAPDKGSVTREKLIEGFNGLADELEGLKQKFVDGTETASEQPFMPAKMSHQI